MSVVHSLIWNGKHLTLLRVEVTVVLSSPVDSTLVAGLGPDLNLVGATHSVVVTGQTLLAHQNVQQVDGNGERLTGSSLWVASLGVPVAVARLADRAPGVLPH